MNFGLSFFLFSFEKIISRRGIRVVAPNSLKKDTSKGLFFP